LKNMTLEVIFANENIQTHGKLTVSCIRSLKSTKTGKKMFSRSRWF